MKHYRVGSRSPHVRGLPLVPAIVTVAAMKTAIAADTGVVEEIFVTGTHIGRSLRDATGPTILITEADLERKPTASLGEVLQALPVQTGATENANNNDADGSTRINLRGLGPQRTLVLLNGRRFIFGGLGANVSVDIDTIPSSLVERVEISASGASAIYGADAVAGVVNVITRQDFSGTHVEGGYSVSEEGDGQVLRGEVVFGHNFARGNLSVGLEYAEQDGVGQEDRAYSAHVESLVNPDGQVANTGNFFPPEGLFDIPPGNALGLPPPSFAYTRVSGSGSQTAADYRRFDPITDFYNYAPYTYLQTPQKRTTAWLMGRYELKDGIETFVEALAQRRDSSQGRAPALYHNFINGAAPVDPRTGAQIIPATNYYNPFGVDIFGLFRTFQEAGGRELRQQIDAYRVLTGLKGEFSRWQWESAVTWGRNTAVEEEPDEILRDEIRNAVGPSGPDASGALRCGQPDPATGIVAPENVIPGCVPLNLFGGLGADGLGTVTSQQLGYISRDLTHHGLNEQWLADATLSGPLGALPAGDIQWAIGAQYRKETGKLRYDPLARQGTSSPSRLTLPDSASFDSYEMFVETHFPLLRDRMVARVLDLGAGVRYSSFSEFGDTTTWSGSLLWRPLNAIAIRGGYSEVFRAPGTLDLFAGEFHEVTGLTDPCGNRPPPAVQQNCLANGVPGGSYRQSGSTPVVRGGNPGLGPESGVTWTAGVLVDPASWRGIRISVDYWNVMLDEAIGSPVAQTIVTECARTGSANACNRITRRADGSISNVDARLANLSWRRVEGIDVAVATSRDFSFGTLAMQLAGTYLESVELKRFNGGTTFEIEGTYDGGVSWPRWRASGVLEWTRGPWRAAYAAQYIDAFRECGDKNFLFPFLDADQCRTVDARLYHDVSATLELGRALRITAAVENLAGTDPPRINLSMSGNSDMSIYRLLGRTYAVQALYTFR